MNAPDADTVTKLVILVAKLHARVDALEQLEARRAKAVRERLLREGRTLSPEEAQ